jgi:hypothetical protein
VQRFLAIAAETGRAAAVIGLSRLVRSTDGAGTTEHGILNLLVAAARTVDGGDVAAALTSTDADELAAEARELGGAENVTVRRVLARCGAGRDEVVALGTLAA